MLRILNRQKRLSISKAVDLTGFESERCKLALENLKLKEYVSLVGSEYWITSAGTGYMAYAKSVRNRI